MRARLAALVALLGMAGCGSPPQGPTDGGPCDARCATPDDRPGEVLGIVVTTPQHYLGAGVGAIGARVTAYAGDGTVAGTANTDEEGRFRLGVPAGAGYRLTFEMDRYRTTTYYRFDMPPGRTVFLEQVPIMSTADATPGDIAGRLADAATGAGLPGVTLALRQGLNANGAADGPVIAQTITDAAGAYALFALEAGVYTAEARRDGYLTGAFTVICEGGEAGGAVTAGQDFAVAPELEEGRTRIVLTWGTEPPDLDAHLTGPAGPGDPGGRFHVYYRQKTHSDEHAYWVVLDTDATSGHGPESVFIYAQLAGPYRFYVEDTTNQEDASSTALSRSGARIDVYRSSGRVARFDVPVDSVGTLWTVFEMDGDVFVPVNEMRYLGYGPLPE